MESKRASIATISDPNNNFVPNINDENTPVDISIRNNSFVEKSSVPGSLPRLPGGPKKKGGAFRLLRAALFMLRPGGKKSKFLEIEVASKGMFHKMVGSMRPLHLQNDQSPPSHHHVIAPSPSPSPKEHLEDVITQSSPVSPLVAYSPSYSSSSVADEGATSQYASALNLHELDESEDEDDEEDGEHNHNDQTNGEDELIDSKAEEFIAHFYEQMKIQNHIEKARRAKHHHDGRI